MTIVTIIGARPQFVKAAVVSQALRSQGISEALIHTGQHYDYKMSEVFWEELGIPTATHNLNVGSGAHGKQTAEMLEKIEQWILDAPTFPDALLVYGDTNSTIAGALAASKLHIPVIHVEAGLRSFNRRMPEEINRVVTDHLSDLLFCSSEVGVRQLQSEGIENGVFNVGDVMYDAVLTFSFFSEEKTELASIIPFDKESFYLMTIHRPSNTDHPEHLDAIMDAISKLKHPVVWPVHPRNAKRLSSMNLPENLHLLEPVSYFEMLRLLASCKKVLTDSGGLQKEAYWLQKPCITIRQETEWVETLEGNWNQLTGPNSEAIISAVNKEPETEWKPIYGTGKAAEAIAAEIALFLKRISSQKK